MKFFLGILCLTLGCGCANEPFSKYHDPSQDLTKDDFFTLTRPQEEELFEADLPPTVPVEPASAHRLVSLTITKAVPLETVFFELGQQARLSVEIGTDLKARVTYAAQGKPLKQVLDGLCSLANLRYHLTDDHLKIEKDAPFLKDYDVNYLALSRKSQSKVSIATDVFKSIGHHKDQMDNGSHSIVTGDSAIDFWEEIDGNLSTLFQVSQDEDVKPFSINRQAGMVSVQGTQKQHRYVESYLHSLQTKAQEQVLIEAKIVEVTLSDQYRSGIDWKVIFGGDLNINNRTGNMTPASPFTGQVPSINDFFSLNVTGNNITALVALIGQFGTVRTLSSPRMTVMNNQSAILKVAENQVFFQVEYDQPVTIATGLNNVNNPTLVQNIVSARSQIHTVPIGLVMAMQPSINKKTGEIMMTLRPTISRVTHTVNDPAVSIASKNTVTSAIPVVEVREFDSVLKLRSGHVGILGGLMQERSKNDASGLPGIQDTPVVGHLFQAKSDNHTVTELVIFLKATIIGRGKKVHPTDKRLYEKFTQDPRPLNL